MKDYFKRKFPHLYKEYRFIIKSMQDSKSISYYRNLPPEDYPCELQKLYEARVGRKLNLNNPVSFTEKIQWRKLNEITPEMSILSDKLAVRDWVKKTIGESYLIPLLGVWSSADEIDFNLLPQAFVLKTNNASGTVITVNKKTTINIRQIKKQLNYWLKIPFGLISGLELQYVSIKPMIIAEKNMLLPGMNDLPDYKFFCFDGKVFCSYTRINTGTYYEEYYSKGQVAFFDRDYNFMPVSREDYKMAEQIPLKPENYGEMVRIAEVLSQGFSHVRVDLYNINGKVYFGEMTFTTHSGFTKFVPESFDYQLGEQWTLPTKH